MSYLLDALRKSEHERRIGQVPTLEPEPIAKEPPRRSHWLIGVIASLVIINSGMLLYVFFSEPDTSQHKSTLLVDNTDSSAANETAKTVRRAVTAKPTPVIKPFAESGQPAMDAPRSISEMIAAKEKQTTAPAQQLVMKVRKPKAPPAAKAPAPPITRSTASPPKESEPTPVKKKSPAPATTTKKTEERKRPAVEATALRSPPSPPIAGSARRPTGPIPLLRKLPSGFRRKVPTMTINVFVYSEQVKERFVIINMSKYRTGDKIENGPVLEAIRPDSLVLSMEGRRFRLKRP